ncbi:MAG: FAD-dependent oxidoreductase [Thermaerobacter sp.]|nr:FAD-dependent oxidoreductase [Thermaerobacter sp.]
MTAAYKYVVVGGGMAADAALRGIRGQDPNGTVLMVSQEIFPPYDRPPLSKGLWKQGGRVENVWRSLDYNQLRVDLRLGVRAERIDAAAHELWLAGGVRVPYERLLLATGGAPRELAGHPRGVTYFRTVEDYFRLRRAMLGGHEAVVVGGGFIGAEMAAALTLAGKHVHLVLPEAGVLSRLLPPSLSAAITEDYAQRGVTVHAGHQVTHVEARGDDSWRVVTDAGAALDASGVVAGLGIVPRVDLMTALGVDCPDGIVVDRLGATAVEAVYAAGDVANFPSPALGRRMRMEHEDHANRHGECVGANMAGQEQAYDYLPFFYSDLFDLGFEAVGRLDSQLATVEDWVEPQKRGVVFYLEDQHVVGVLAVDLWDRMDRARALIVDGEPVGDGSRLRGRLTG